jgi:hypothetical protein
VDAFERLLELDDCPPSLQLSPQDNRPPLQPAPLHEAIVFDHPLCACGPVACIGVINWHHPVSVRPQLRLNSLSGQTPRCECVESSASAAYHRTFDCGQIRQVASPVPPSRVQLSFGADVSR